MKKQSSRLIYGCMGLGGNWDHNPLQNENIKQAQEVVEMAMEMGIDTFDHADVYTFGKAEKVFGEVLKAQPALRDKIIIQGKSGIRVPALKPEDTVGYYDLSRDYIFSQVEKSLKNLNIETMDVFLFHRPDPWVRAEEMAKTAQELHKKGMVKEFGVSNMSGPQIRRLAQYMDVPLKVSQVQLSLGHRDFVEAQVTFNHSATPSALWFGEGSLEACLDLGLEIQAWSPLHEGVFTGRPTNNPNFQKAAALVWDLSRKYMCSPESLVLAWLLVLPYGIRPVVGTTHQGRLDACKDGEKVQLSKQDWYWLWSTVRGSSLP